MLCMLYRRPQRRSLVWLLLLTLLLATLAPGVARALVFSRGDAAPWSVVCSRLGTAQDGGAPASEPAHLFEHCPFCALQANPWAPPPAALAAVPAPLLGLAVPVLFLRAPRPLFAWAHAQPRAPPLSA